MPRPVANAMWSLCFCLPGFHSSLHCWLDGPLDVGQRPGPGQFFNSLFDSAGWPAWDRFLGTQLPHPLAHWRSGHRCGGLKAPFLDFFPLPSSSPSVTFPPPFSQALLCHPLPLFGTLTLILDSHYFQWEFYVVYISSQVCTGKIVLRRAKQKKV